MARTPTTASSPSPFRQPTKRVGTTRPTMAGGDWSMPGTQEDEWYDAQMYNIMLDRQDITAQLASWQDVLDMTSGVGEQMANTGVYCEGII